MSTVDTKETGTRFIEKHADGTATLRYPGWPEQVYGSVGSALNRRRAIETGAALRSKQARLNCFSPEEDRFVRENWGKITIIDWPSRLPGRTYAAVKTYARRNEIRAVGDFRARGGRTQRIKGPRANSWNDQEIEILRTQPRAEATRLLAPRRTPKAVEAMASRFGLKARVYNGIWSRDEILILLNNNRKTAQRLLAPKRTTKGVNHMAAKLGLQELRRWPDAEMALIRTILRAKAALKAKYGRKGKAIFGMLARESERQRATDAAIAAVDTACAGLPTEIRQDVANELLVSVLSKELALADLASAVRSARTKAYGRRHYSLDAPIGDGSMAWIDTIASDREHF